MTHSGIFLQKLAKYCGETVCGFIDSGVHGEKMVFQCFPASNHTDFFAICENAEAFILAVSLVFRLKS